MEDRPQSTSYRDNPFEIASASGHRPNSDLVDYYDEGPLPAPHRFTSSSPYPSSASASLEHLPATAPVHSTPSLVNHSSYTAVPTSQPNMDYGSGGMSEWLEKQTKRKRRYKWTVIISLIVIALIIIGVVVGVVVAKNNNNNKKSSNLSSGSGASADNGGPTGVVQSDPNDPSNFKKDDRLIKSFYGLAYTPQNVILPNCNGSQADIIEDIQLISQLTDKIRLYGADCNQTQLVLEAIKVTKVDLKVFVGNYVTPDDPTAYQRQKDELQDAFQKYGIDNILGLTVGNEFMLNYVTDHGGPNVDINGPVANEGAQILINMIDDSRQWLQGLNINLPVGTSDAGSYFNNMVLQKVDYGLSNVHAWFAEVAASDAAGWVAEFFQDTNIAESQAVSNHPAMYIAETGWPTTANDTAHLSNGGTGTASEAGLQTFLDDFVCQANANGTKYFFFEAFDEPWKDIQFGGVEAHWGIFTANKTLKHVTIPKC